MECGLVAIKPCFTMSMEEPRIETSRMMVLQMLTVAWHLIAGSLGHLVTWWCATCHDAIQDVKSYLVLGDLCHAITLCHCHGTLPLVLDWGAVLDQRPVPAVSLARCKKAKSNLFPRRDSLRVLSSICTCQDCVFSLGFQKKTTCLEMGRWWVCLSAVPIPEYPQFGPQSSEASLSTLMRTAFLMVKDNYCLMTN